MTKKIILLGVAASSGAEKTGTEQAPETCQKAINLPWAEIIKEIPTGKKENALAGIVQYNTKLAKSAYQLTQEKRFFIVIGGDHACAIGTWSGVSCALNNPFGLIWIDAHMDSHTSQTSPSQNIHGMPVAALLGEGLSELTEMQCRGPKISPKHLILIGIRSYEQGEADLLKKLGVKIYYIDEVKKRGLKTVFEEASSYLARHCQHFGVSLDIDALDPEEAPGTGTREKDGIRFAELLPLWRKTLNHPQCIAAEIAEFNPSLDQDGKTLRLIKDLLTL